MVSHLKRPVDESRALLPPGEVVTRQRFHVLAILCLLTCVNAFLGFTFVAISDYTSAFFSISISNVNLLVYVYPILYLPGTLFSTLLLEKYGLRASLLIGTALQFIGSSLRLLSLTFVPATHSTAFPVLLTGQALAALAQPCMLNVCTRTAGTWFSTSEHSLAITMPLLFHLLGISLANIISNLVVKCTARHHVSNCPGSSITGFEPMLSAQWMLAAFAAMWTMLCFEDHPKVPPSRAQQLRWDIHWRHESTEEASVQLCSKLRQLCSKKEFLLLIASFCPAMALMYTMLIMTRPTIVPTFFYHNETDSDAYELNEEQATDAAHLYQNLMLFAGLATGMVTARPLPRRNYAAILKRNQIGAFLAILMLAEALRPGNEYRVLTGAAFFLLGAFLLPLLPTYLEAGTECTYPIPQEYASGCLMFAGQTGAAVLCAVTPTLIDMEPNCHSWNSQWTHFSVTLTLISSFGVVISMLFTGEYNQQAAGNQGTPNALLNC